MTYTETQSALAASLQAITDLVPTLSESEWHRPYNGKWSLAQEVEHLWISTRGTTFLFGKTGRTTWRPTAQPSRPYETSREQYQLALAARNGFMNRNLTVESDVPDLSAQVAVWPVATTNLLNAVAGISESELLGSTVWKHPLLGPLTGWEMLFFTIHHTRHHYDSLVRKQRAIEQSTNGGRVTPQ